MELKNLSFDVEYNGFAVNEFHSVSHLTSTWVCMCVCTYVCVFVCVCVWHMGVGA